MKSIFYTALWAAFLYAGYAFVELDLDPLCWAKSTRAAWAFYFVCGSLGLLLISNMTIIKSEENGNFNSAHSDNRNRADFTQLPNKQG